MSGLTTVAATVCACTIVAALLSHFVTDGSMKRLMQLIMGAFVVCAMAVPVANAVGAAAADWQTVLPEEQAATADEAVSREVLLLTKQNLEQAMADILAQNGYPVKKAEVTLALTDKNRVTIAAAVFTIGAAYADAREEIAALVERHFAVTPQTAVE